MILSFFIFLNLAFAEQAKANASSNEVIKKPICFDDSQQIENIKTSVLANKTSKFKYQAYEKLFSQSGITDIEILARLIYAETKASRCVGKELDTAKLIAEVVHHRVQKRLGKIKSVVFERDNFASSLNFYDESAYPDFLCPKDPKLWQAVTNKVSDLLKNPESNSQARNTYHYYFFMHSPRFTPPVWTKQYTMVREVQVSSEKCFQTYSNPNWK